MIQAAKQGIVMGEDNDALYTAQERTTKELSDAWNGKEKICLNKDTKKKFLKWVVLEITGGIWTKWMKRLMYSILK